jgi:hypothetical protein
LAAALAMAAQGGEKSGKASNNAAAGGGSSSSSSSVSSGTGISVKTENGQTTVTYKGEEVFKGQTSGKVSARSSSVNGNEYAAAFDGDKVLWESASGASEQVKASGIELPSLDKTPKKASKKRRSES